MLSSEGLEEVFSSIWAENAFSDHTAKLVIAIGMPFLG